MKILCINLQHSKERKPFSHPAFPLGLAYITAILKNEGYEVTCLDMELNFCLGKKNHIQLGTFDIVMYGGTFFGIDHLKDISKEINNYDPKIVQIAGGNFATLIADLILKETPVNAVCMYDSGDIVG